MLKRTSRACRGGWDSPDHVKVTGRAVELGVLHVQTSRRDRTLAAGSPATPDDAVELVYAAYLARIACKWVICRAPLVNMGTRNG